MHEKRYKVTLNWYSEIHEFWIHAASIAQVKVFAFRKFTAKTERRPNSVWAYFNGNKDNIKIKEE